MSKVTTCEAILDKFLDGQTIMIGGFLAVGTPEKLLALLIQKGVQDITIIANDTAYIGKGIGKIISSGQLKKAIVSHIGTNAETGKLMSSRQLDVELVPQGTLAERIRCGGAGLGGILTPTGVGTSVEEGKKLIVQGNKAYLLELPLHADIALIKAAIADTSGNLVYRRSARNFNPIMATSADLVIAEVEEIVPIGSLDPDLIVTPGVLVDMVIKGGDNK